MENLLDCTLCNLTAVRINKTRIEPGNKAEKINLFFDDFLPLQKNHMNSHVWFHVKSCDNMWNYVIVNAFYYFCNLHSQTDKKQIAKDI
jgi:hypothetical protein